MWTGCSFDRSMLFNLELQHRVVAFVLLVSYVSSLLLVTVSLEKDGTKDMELP